MNVLISQALSLLAIVGIGIVIFKYFPLHVATKDIALTALLVVLSVVLSFFSLMIPLFGFMSFKIGFSQMPLMLLGVVLGPAWAFIGALVQDLLDIIINPSGFPFLGFTLNKVIIAVVPALWFSRWNKLDQNRVFRLIWALLIILASLMFGAIWSTVSITVSDTVVVFTAGIKLVLSGTCLLIMVLLVIIMLYFKRKYPYRGDRYHIANWIVCVLLIEMIVQMVLTPVWLDVMYGIPYIMNVIVRLIKSGFMIFLNIMIGYYLLKLIVRLRGN